MVDAHEQKRRCNISKLKKLFIILLIVPALILSYTFIQTHIQVAVFDTASKHHRQIQLKSKDVTGTAAVYRGDVSAVNYDKVNTDLEEENKAVSLEKNTADLLGVTTASDTTVFNVNTPLTKALNDTSKHQRTANTGPTAVILLTYMRSGSSLTGDILQQPDNAFYVFEPIKNAKFISLAEKPIHFINGTSQEYGKYDLERIYEETLYGWLTCDLYRVYGESLLDIEFLAFGNKFRKYHACIGSSRFQFQQLLRQHMLHKNEHFIKCVDMLQETCSKSKFRIVKTIRTSMEVAKLIMNRIPNSKILHLLRDPRATIESQRHRGRCQKGLTLCIAEHCDDVRKDTTAKQSIISDVPTRIDQVLYEDIASRPIVTTKKMYSFIGMNLTETIANYVYNLTKGKDKSGCSVCLVKWQIGNSDASSETHIAAWKTKLPGQYINQTQIICKDVIKYYGYEEYRAPPVLINSKTKTRRFKTLLETIRSAH